MGVRVNVEGARRPPLPRVELCRLSARGVEMLRAEAEPLAEAVACAAFYSLLSPSIAFYSSPPAFSGTNVQVQGVDEADIVKTNQKHNQER